MEKETGSDWPLEKDDILDHYLDTGDPSDLAGLSAEEQAEAKRLLCTAKTVAGVVPQTNLWVKREGKANLQAAVAARRGEPLNRLRFHLIGRFYGVLASILPSRK